jgi:holo-[acyl-carrier protein] synthase
MKNENFGVGADIENIDRFEKLNRHENAQFLNKIFTKNELDYCFSKKQAASHLAARYAGKEAVFKALNGVGITNLNYKEIEIFNNKDGIPMVKINSTHAHHNLKVYLSLSHCKDKAIAFAVVTKTLTEECK